jgi:hypothetical protein
MRLTCISSRAMDLTEEQRPRGSLPQSTYPVTAGGTYLVLGIQVWENFINLLVEDDDGLPAFVPAGLFDLGTWRIPDGWSFGLFAGLRVSGRDRWSEPLVAAWGYEEFVSDSEHASALAEMDANALRVFSLRTAEAHLAGVARTDQ